MSVKFGDQIVGDGHPCCITFEAGPTHDGLETAKELVRLSAEAGAEAIKFQILDPDRLVQDRKMLFTYKVLADRETGRMEEVSEPLYDILCRRAMSKEQWREVKAYSDKLGLAFFATVGFEDEVDLLAELGCDCIKIASGDVNHFPLIRRAARTGMCIQLDTGSSTIGEVEAAVDVVRSEGNENIIINHCPSGYPARRTGINMNVLPTLKRMFDYPVAFSDHTPGHDMDVAALALGANLLEKTITLDRTTPSVEHVMSLEPHEMKAFVETVREIEDALGTSRRVLHKAEREYRVMNRRSVFLRSAVKKGQSLGEANVEFRRPGKGIAPDLYEDMVSLRFCCDLPAGHMVTHGDLEQ